MSPDFQLEKDMYKYFSKDLWFLCDKSFHKNHFCKVGMYTVHYWTCHINHMLKLELFYSYNFPFKKVHPILNSCVQQAWKKKMKIVISACP